MAINLNIDTDLDVVAKQKELVAESIGPDGIYVRMKDTLEELINKGELKKSPDAAKVIAETIASMANNITNSAMSTAIQWESQQKALAFQKAELEYRLDLLDNQVKESEQNQSSTLARKNLDIANTIRNFGTYTTDASGNLVSLDNNGKGYQQELILKEQVKMEGHKESVMNQTVADKVATSGYEKDKALSETTVVQGVETAKISQATAQLDKTNAEKDYIDTQKSQLIASVTYNNKIRAMNALGQTYGTFGAGGLTVSGDMWNTYFTIASELSAAALPTSTTITKVS